MPKVKKTRKDPKPDTKDESPVKHQGHSVRSARWGIRIHIGGETSQSDDWMPPLFDEQLMHYYVWVKHRGDQTEREHYHLFIHFRRAWTKTGARNFLGVTTGYDAKAMYVDKTEYLTDGHTTIDGPYSFGHPDVTSGTRTDIAEAIAMAKAGSTAAQVVEKQPQLLPFTRIIDQYFCKRLDPTEPKRPVKVIVLYGPRNTGKSHRAKMQYLGDYYEVKPGRGPWDNYSGQACVEFSEFRDAKWDISDMNTYLDDWYTQLDCRGTGNNKTSLYTTVIITSNTHPFTWYPQEPQDLREAFFSRLQHVIEVTSKDTEINLKALPKLDRS